MEIKKGCNNCAREDLIGKSPICDKLCNPDTMSHWISKDERTVCPHCGETVEELFNRGKTGDGQ